MSTQDINNVRSLDQLRKMKKLAKAKACLFCPEGIAIVEKTILYRGEYWHVTPNDYPYQGASVHVLIVPNRHLQGITDLLPNELLELPEMVAWVNKEFGIKGAGLFCRYGDTAYSGGTINHFHIHIVSGKEKLSKEHEPIFAVLGYREDFFLDTNK